MLFMILLTFRRAEMYRFTYAQEDIVICATFKTRVANDNSLDRLYIIEKVILFIVLIQQVNDNQLLI